MQSSTTGLSLGSLPTRSYAMLGAASQEYSVAYFGFDSPLIMDQFVEKYNNFVVEVDQKRKYSLEVKRALYQPMPTLRTIPSKDKNKENNSFQIDTASTRLEDLPDFKHFQRTLALKKPILLPLEVQIQIEREKKASEAQAAQLVSISSLNFREAGDDEDLDEIDRHVREMEGEITKPPARPEKKKLKMSSKVAPLVAAINEQAALGKAIHLNE